MTVTLAGSAPDDLTVISVCAGSVLSSAQPVAPTADEISCNATAQWFASTVAS